MEALEITVDTLICPETRNVGLSPENRILASLVASYSSQEVWALLNMDESGLKYSYIICNTFRFLTHFQYFCDFMYVNLPI